MKTNRKIILLTALATSAAWVLLLAVAFWVFMMAPQPRSDDRYIIQGLRVPNHSNSASALIVEQFDDRSSKASEVFRLKIPPGESGLLSIRTAPYASSATPNP